MRARAALFVISLATLGGEPAPVAAQQNSWTLGGGAQFQYFSFSDPASVNMESLSLLTLPLDAGVRVGRNVTLRLAGFWARGERRKFNGETVSIQGLTDTRLSANVTFADGVASLTGIVALPTGNSTQNQDEEGIAANVASDLFPFRVSNWGSGGGAGVRATAAQRFGKVGAGLSVGYFAAQDFNPRTGDETLYKAGNNVVVRAVLDGNVGRAGKASLQLSFHTFGDDLVDGTGFYQSGKRFQAIGSYAFAMGRRSSGVVYAGAMRRAKGEELQGAPSIGAKTLFMAGSGTRLRVGGTLLLPTVDLRLLRAEDGVDQGFNARIGAAAEIGVGNVVLLPLARVHLGRLAVVEGKSESSYVGADLGIGVRFGGGGR